MSRNICSTSCQRCGSEDIVLDEAPRPITRDDAGRYFSEYEGMVVANATCAKCKAMYLAWLDGTKCVKPHGFVRGIQLDPYPKPWSDGNGGLMVRDLSYRSSFDDEPNDEDLPPWEKPEDEVKRLRAELHEARWVAMRLFEYVDNNESTLGDDEFTWTHRLLKEWFDQ